MTTKALFVDASQCDGALRIEELCAQATEAGFDGIELNMRVDGEVGEDEFGVRQLAALSTGPRPLPIVALSTGLKLDSVEGTTQRVRSLLRCASRLDASVLSLVFPPLRMRSLRAGNSGFIRYQDSLNFVYEVLRSVRHDAEASGAALAVQGAEGGCLLSPVEHRELIDAVNCWAIGACVDAHAVYQLGDPADWVATLKHRVHAVRLWYAGTNNHESDRPAADLPDFEGMRTALQETRYDRLIIVAGEESPQALIGKLNRVVPL